MQMQRPTLEVPLAEECELPAVALGNAVANGGRGHEGPSWRGVVAVASEGVYLVAEDGSASRITIQGRAADASPVLVAAWEPSYQDRNARPQPSFLALASADRLELCVVEFTADAVKARVMRATPLKRRPRQLRWARFKYSLPDVRELRVSHVLCVADSMDEITLFQGRVDPPSATIAPLEPLSVLSFAYAVEDWTWNHMRSDNDADASWFHDHPSVSDAPSLWVLCAGDRVHRYDFLLRTDLLDGKDFLQHIGPWMGLPRHSPSGTILLKEEPSESDALGGGLSSSLRGRCLGALGFWKTGVRMLFVAVEESGLEQQLRQHGQGEGEAGKAVLNTTLQELRRTQRRESVPGAREEEQQGEEKEGEDTGGTAGSGIIDLVGKMRASTVNSAGGIPGGLLLGLHRSTLEDASPPPPPQQPPRLMVVRAPMDFPKRRTDANDVMTLTDTTQVLASAPLPGGGPAWSPSLLANDHALVVVGSHLSSTLLSFRWDSERVALEELVPLALPEGFRPRGLAVHGGHAFCFAARRVGSARGAGAGGVWGKHAARVFIFRDVAAAKPKPQQEQQPEQPEQQQRLQEQQPLATNKEDESASVLSLLRDFRREVLDRLSSLEAAVGAQNDRLGRLEARLEQAASCQGVGGNA